ncbi:MULTISPECIES: hypothetical protein [Paraburkholderia]|uniref:hypothetical protein n=1 Tax=Paraburkholderia TaxID=1822464 RepID=UPI0038BA8F8C
MNSFEQSTARKFIARLRGAHGAGLRWRPFTPAHEKADALSIALTQRRVAHPIAGKGRDHRANSPQDASNYVKPFHK